VCADSGLRRARVGNDRRPVGQLPETVMADPKPQQLKLSLGNVNARQFAPVPEAQRGAREYAKSRGRKYSTEGLANVQADPQSQFRLQHAFRQKMASGPQSSPGIQRSYSALSGAIEDQHEYMTKTLGITHEVVDHEGSPGGDSRVAGPERLPQLCT
jgi:hypothetical protein